jgi:hypothetical protein
MIGHQIHQAQALWAWWIWCQTMTATDESHCVAQLAIRREASLKKSILKFFTESGTWNKARDGTELGYNISRYMTSKTQTELEP